MAPRKVLVVLTSHSKLISGKPTGWYLPEFAHPYDEFAAAGFEVTVASPAGGTPPVDPRSVEMFKDDSSVAFLATKQHVYERSLKLGALAGDLEKAAKTARDYDALFYPGGHGPMFDLATDADNQRLAAAFAAAGKVVAAVCHGPAALVNVHVDAEDPSSAYLVAGRRVGGFTDAEERAVEMVEEVPFLLESRLREAGAVFEAGPEWGEKVVVDGKLITGQNPASAKLVGASIVKALQG